MLAVKLVSALGLAAVASLAVLMLLVAALCSRRCVSKECLKVGERWITYDPDRSPDHRRRSSHPEELHHRRRATKSHQRCRRSLHRRRRSLHHQSSHPDHRRSLHRHGHRRSRHHHQSSRLIHLGSQQKEALERSLKSGEGGGTHRDLQRSHLHHRRRGR